MITYQNNLVSSFLFYRNLPLIFSKGVNVCELLSSNIFKFNIEEEDWPTSHTNPERVIMPYSGSIF